jgi:DNA repair protein RecO (recombination protein O)
MKPRTAEAFVLQTWSLGEADLLVSLFTREEGKLRGVGRSARRSRKRFAGALEPLTRVRVTFVEREGSDLARLEEMEVVRSYFPAQAEPAVLAAFAYVAEVIDQFAREKQADERTFRLVGSVLDGLARGIDPRLAARYFETWTLRLQGLLPDLQACPSCGRPLAAGGWYDRRHGEVSCAGCPPESGAGERVDAGALHLAASVLAEPLEAVAARRPEPAAVAGLGALMTSILARFLERPLRSLRLLEELSP